MLRTILIAIALLVAPAAAGAQSVPDDQFDPKKVEQFRFCHAALVFHRQTENWENARFGQDITATLSEMSLFVMSEALFGEPSANVGSSAKRVQFAEGFFFSVADIIAKRGSELADLKTREAYIAECVPLIWLGVRTEINHLLGARRARAGEPPKLQLFE